MAPRGRGGKFSKPSRGGGKHFSRDVQPVDKDGNRVGMWREPEEDPDTSSSEEEGTESEEESSSDDATNDQADGGASSSAAAPELTREERRAAAKAKKQAAIARRQKVQPGDLPPSDWESDDENKTTNTNGGDEDLPANPNHTAKSRSQLSGDAPEKVAKDPSQLSRREREAVEAQQARERYMKLHAEGKTDEARADLARLALVREKREQDRLRKEAEKEEKAELAKARAEEREAKLGVKKKGASKKK